MSDSFGKLIGRNKSRKSSTTKTRNKNNNKNKNKNKNKRKTLDTTETLAQKKPKLCHDATFLHPRELRRAIAAHKRPPPTPPKPPAHKVVLVDKVKTLQEICAKRLSDCMERFQHQTFRLDSKTFAAILKMAGSRLTEPVLTSLSIANPRMAEELEEGWKCLYKQRYGSASGLSFARSNRSDGASWHAVFLKFTKRRRKELKRAKKHAKKKMKAAKKSSPHRKTKKVRVVPMDISLHGQHHPSSATTALTPAKVSSSRATTVFDSPSILEKLKYRRQVMDGESKRKMGRLKAQCLQLKATKRK